MQFLKSHILEKSQQILENLIYLILSIFIVHLNGLYKNNNIIVIELMLNIEIIDVINHSKT
jgi:hypothetical protein